MVIGLELAVLRITGEGDHVADILHAGHKEYQTLKAETETRVRNGTKLAGIHIP